MLFFLTALVAAALAAPPTPYKFAFKVFVDSKLPASQYMVKDMPGQITIPEGVFNMTQIEVNHDNEEFMLCLKQGVAAPAAAGTLNWKNADYCDLFHFKNSTASVTMWNEMAKRSINDQLRGSGSDVANNDRSFSGASHVRRRMVSSSVGSEAHIQLKNIRAGDYYVTMAAPGLKNKNMTATLTVSGFKCPQGGQDGYHKCEVLPVLEDSKDAVTGKIDSWASFVYGGWDTIDAQTAELTVSAMLSKPVSNTTATIYARYGALPTAEIHDFALPALTFADKKPVVGSIPLPASRMWYFAVHNPNAQFPAMVNITVSQKQCDKGKMGANCDVVISKLNAASEVQPLKNAKKGDKIYFEYQMNTTGFGSPLSEESIAFAAAALGEDPKPKVYARYGMLPTDTEFDLYDCSTASCSKDQATLILSDTDVVGDDKWYVLVVPQGNEGIVAWDATNGACANDCGGHGKCDTAAATCTCDEDFASFDCAVSTNKLENWEWALIIGGAVLIAIGLIGCIVFFIQKQQRRAGFERV